MNMQHDIVQRSHTMPYSRRDGRYETYNPPDNPPTIVSQLRENIFGLSSLYEERVKQDRKKGQLLEQREDDLHQQRTNRTLTMYHQAASFMSPNQQNQLSGGTGVVYTSGVPPHQEMQPQYGNGPSASRFDSTGTAFRPVSAEAVPHHPRQDAAPLEPRNSALAVQQPAAETSVPAPVYVMQQYESLPPPTPQSYFPSMPKGYICAHCMHPGALPRIEIDTNTCVFCNVPLLGLGHAV